MTIGTVGTNFIVDRFIEAARASGADVSAVYSRNGETARAFAGRHGVAAWYDDRAAFLNSALDFIYVAAPNSLHYEWSRDALNAGRNVICEKPFVSNAAELETLIALAKSRKRFLFEALTVPHLPNFRLIRETLPRLGTIRFVQLAFSQYSSRYGAFLEGKNPNLFNPEFSGGALMDLNYYNLCLIQRLFGMPEEIRYFANKAENGVDISGILILRYDGFIASAAAAKDSDGKNFVQIQGEAGSLYAASPSSNLSGGFVLHTRTGKTPAGETYNAQEYENVLRYEAADFAVAFAAGDPGVCGEPLADALCAARLMDRARKDAGIVFPADAGRQAG
ncbi:MAG: Gfo/Idh/MocA family oxidoreductase [Treponema sp.]|jgi:predicted dehydrogenase|nr:Gfo/Idh/MocA family oxidoreductase [Treponema sp.]